LESKEYLTLTYYFQTFHGPRQVIYSQIKVAWASGAQQSALAQLQAFIERSAQEIGFDKKEAEKHAGAELRDHIPDSFKLLAKCYLTLGDWNITLAPNWGLVNFYILSKVLKQLTPQSGFGSRNHHFI
jgi:FKBP12-rapamycin complex-associated protein